MLWTRSSPELPVELGAAVDFGIQPLSEAVKQQLAIAREESHIAVSFDSWQRCEHLQDESSAEQQPSWSVHPQIVVARPLLVFQTTSFEEPRDQLSSEGPGLVIDLAALQRTLASASQ
jgi:hypothetical protein